MKLYIEEQLTQNMSRLSRLNSLQSNVLLDNLTCTEKQSDLLGLLQNQRHTFTKNLPLFNKEVQEEAAEPWLQAHFARRNQVVAEAGTLQEET
jgi:predicted FMN-binding regulatory protein PaiB